MRDQRLRKRKKTEEIDDVAANVLIEACRRVEKDGLDEGKLYLNRSLDFDCLCEIQDLFQQQAEQSEDYVAAMSQKPFLVYFGHHRVWMADPQWEGSLIPDAPRLSYKAYRDLCKEFRVV